LGPMKPPSRKTWNRSIPRRSWKMRPYGLVSLHRCCQCPICQDAPRTSRAQQKRADVRVVEEYADWDQEPEDLLWWADALGLLESETSWWIDWLDLHDPDRLEWYQPPQMSPLRAAMVAWPARRHERRQDGFRNPVAGR
jgi:hypothetical protein